MHSTSQTQISAAAKRWVIGCLVMALALSAWAAGVAQVYSARHFHQSPPSSSAAPSGASAPVNVLAWFGVVFSAPLRPVFVHAPSRFEAHFHDELESHEHDAADVSVVSVKASSAFEAARAELAASAAKASSFLSQPAALTPPPPSLAADASHTPWCEALRWVPQTSDLLGLLRPPKQRA
jgi:hypothetical protein